VDAVGDLSYLTNFAAGKADVKRAKEGSFFPLVKGREKLSGKIPLEVVFH
jgi:hypothetical protein